LKQINSFLQVWRFTHFFNLEETKVVIIGQSPYHNKGQAHGLSFSVPEGVDQPRSLKNIFKKLVMEGFSCPDGGSLKRWSKQKVLLVKPSHFVKCNPSFFNVPFLKLNSVLTIKKGGTSFGEKRHWEEFTLAVINCIK